MVGGGDRGKFLDIGCVADATLKTAIDGMIAAGTPVQGLLVKLSGAAYTVTSVSDGDVAEGKIMSYEKTASGYRLVVRLWSCINSLSVRFNPSAIVNVPYTGALSIGNAVVASATAKTVKAGAASGWGYVIGKDTPSSGFCDVLV